MNSIRKYRFLLGTILIFAALILIGPMDFFTHGAYGDPITLSTLSENDFVGTVPLDQEAYSIRFTPQRDHFSGFWIYPDLRTSNAEGSVFIETRRQDGTRLEHMEIPVSKMSGHVYYYVETNGAYFSGETYEVAFWAEGTDSAPSLYLVTAPYIPAESTQSNLLIGYLYAAPVFSLAEKVIISFLLLSAWFFMLGTFGLGNQYSSKTTLAKFASLYLALVSLFTMNYMFAVFYSDDTAATFSGSDELVLSVLEAPAHGLQQNAFGLGDLVSGRGTYFTNGKEADYRNDNNWDHGFAKTEPMIALSKNAYTGQFATVGTTILFENGVTHTVSKVEQNNAYYVITLSAEAPLSYQEYGSLDSATYYTPDGREFPAYSLFPYTSQVGFQGKVFVWLSNFMPEGKLENAFHLLCSMAMGGILSILILLLQRRYGLMMAVCFGVTFLCSPWIGAAASSLYWVSFTWFLPMVVGLICAVWIEKRAVRIWMIFLGYGTVLVKALCGYEYMTTVMLGLIAFLLADFLLALIRRERERSILLFRTIFIMGIFALLAFLTAILIHANLRGNGDLLNGLTAIYQGDVLRRSNACKQKVKQKLSEICRCREGEKQQHKKAAASASA